MGCLSSKEGQSKKSPVKVKKDKDANALEVLDQMYIEPKKEEFKIEVAPTEPEKTPDEQE